MIQTKLFKTHRLPAWIILFLFFFMGIIQSAAASEAASHPSFNKIREKGILRVGVSLFTPWTLKDKNGESV